MRVNRRDFLKTGAVSILGAPGIIPSRNRLFAGLVQTSSPLVTASHPAAMVLETEPDNIKVVSCDVNREIVTAMVDSIVLELTGRNSVAAAWESLFPAGMLSEQTKVAIKINTVGGWDEAYLADNDWRYVLCPFVAKAAVVDAVVGGLTRMLDGTFPVENITVFDRYQSVMSFPGYPNQISMPVQGFRGFTPESAGDFYVDEAEGSYRIWLVTGSSGQNGNNYVRSPEYSNPDLPAFVVAPERPEAYRAAQVLAPPLYEADCWINISNAKDHRAAGITGSLKNSYGCVDFCEGTHGPTEHWLRDDVYVGVNRGVPSVYKNVTQLRPCILNVMDGLGYLYNDGPCYGPVSLKNVIAASVDPVTLDYHELLTMNEIRAGRGLRAIETTGEWAPEQGETPNALHLGVAASEFGLGNLNNDHITEVPVGVRGPSGGIPALQRPQSSLRALRRDGKGWRLELAMDNSGRSHVVDSRIEDLRGRAIRTFGTATTRSENISITWDGRGDRGTPVAAGLYTWKAFIDGRMHSETVRVR